jgi:rhomboid protease GluP
MNRPARKSILCPNCRKIISADESRCPHCGIAAPGARWKNSPLTRGWGSGDRLVRIIIFTNIGMYLYSLFLSAGFLGSGFNPVLMFSPSDYALRDLGATGTILVHENGWWTLISANYLHGGVLHIFFNMFAFYQIAPLTTRLFGPYRFFIIFTLSGIGGFMATYFAGTPVTVGASAALCGLIGAAVYYGKNRGGLFGQTIYKQIGGWAIGILLFGFLVPRVDNWAHIGGMLFGVLLALTLGYNEKSHENLGHRVLAGVCMVVTAMTLAYAALRGAGNLLG